MIGIIARAPIEAWEIDADRYTHDVCKPLLELGSQIRAAFPDGATDTLVTKIMLGVFGSVPAFDTNFKTGFGVYAFGESALTRVGPFYRDNAEAIEQHRVPTLDFEHRGRVGPAAHPRQSDRHHLLRRRSSRG